MVFTSNCKHCIETIPTLVTSDKNPEDLDTDGEDHLADAIRYCLMFIFVPKTMREKNKTPKWLQELQRKAKGSIEEGSLVSAWTA